MRQEAILIFLSLLLLTACAPAEIDDPVEQPVPVVPEPDNPDLPDPVTGYIDPDAPGAPAIPKPIKNWTYDTGNPDGEGAGILGCAPGEFYEHYRLYWRNYPERQGHHGTRDPSDAACCPSDKHCVYQGECYEASPTTFIDTDGNGAVDYFCYPYDLGDGWWVNMDYHQMYCDRAFGPGHWNIGGNATVEDKYWSNRGGPRPGYCTIGNDGHPSWECCCGDDTGEYVVETDGRRACCASPEQCVDEQGKCTQCA